MKDYIPLSCVLLGCLSPFALADEPVTIAEEKKPRFSLDVSAAYKPWLISWEQKSEAADRFGNKAIDVDYDIDAAVANAFALKFDMVLFGHKVPAGITKYETQQKPEATDIGDNSLSALSMGIDFVEVFGKTSLSYSPVQTQFKGYIEGSYNGETGTGSFESDMALHDFRLVFPNHFGLGYRYMSYDVPQDVYLVGPNSNDPILSGFVDMSYRAHYATFNYANNRFWHNGHHTGLSLSAAAGYGIIQPEGDFIKTTEATLRDSGELGSDEELMKDGSSWFYDLDVALYHNIPLG